MTQQTFKDETLRAFQFLLKEGFRLKSAISTLVEFEGEHYQINVYHGRHSREIDAEIVSNGDLPVEVYSFRTLARVFDEAFSDQLPVVSASETSEKIKERIDKLSDDFKRVVNIDCLKSRKLLLKLRTARGELEEKMNSRYPSTSREELSSRFRDLWDSQQYGQLVNLFEPIQTNLTGAEHKMLEAAKKDGCRIQFKNTELRIDAKPRLER